MHPCIVRMALACQGVVAVGMTGCQGLLEGEWGRTERTWNLGSEGRRQGLPPCCGAHPPCCSLLEQAWCPWGLPVGTLAAGSQSSPGRCGSVTWNCRWNDLTPAGGQWLVLRRPLGPDWKEHTTTTKAGCVFGLYPHTLLVKAPLHITISDNSALQGPSQ